MQITVEAVLFWIFAGITVFSALAVVSCKRIIYSTLSLILVFLSIAAFFVMNNADFLAIAQLIVYAVGLTIILLFGVMFTGTQLESDEPQTPAAHNQQWLFGIVCAMFGALLVAAQQFPYVQKAPSAALVNTLQTQGSTGLLGKAIFTQHVVSFEMASVLLLVAMIGAIMIAKKRLDVETASPTLDVTRFPVNLSSAPKQVVEPQALVMSGVESSR